MGVEIYTDGAYSSKRLQGGWAIVAVNDGDVLEVSGHDKSGHATNNTMEMTAMLNALRLAHTLAEVNKDVEVNIVSDSEYVLKGIQDWMAGWKADNWKKGKLKNLELWKEIDNLVNSGTFKLSFQWTRGHIGNKYNEVADKLAVKESHYE